MDKLFFDTNVLLDVLEKRAPWFPEAFECLARVQSGQCSGAITALSLSDIAYIQRATPPSTLVAAFRRLRSFLEVAALTKQTVDAALNLQLEDLEDGFQLEAAIEWGATHLLTRNVQDFPSDAPIRILSPSDYLGL
jgi:predicted nucleic acid-binding protein